jgi:hypothetical protein
LIEVVNGNEVIIEGNDIMNLTLTQRDNVTPAGTDTISFTLQRSKGGTWFTIQWDGTKTNEKAITNGQVSIK